MVKRLLKTIAFCFIFQQITANPVDIIYRSWAVPPKIIPSVHGPLAQYPGLSQCALRSTLFSFLPPNQSFQSTSKTAEIAFLDGRAYGAILEFFCDRDGFVCPSGTRGVSSDYAKFVTKVMNLATGRKNSFMLVDIPLAYFCICAKNYQDALTWQWKNPGKKTPFGRWIIYDRIKDLENRDLKLQLKTRESVVDVSLSTLVKTLLQGASGFVQAPGLFIPQQVRDPLVKPEKFPPLVIYVRTRDLNFASRSLPIAEYGVFGYNPVALGFPEALGQWLLAGGWINIIIDDSYRYYNLSALGALEEYANKGNRAARGCIEKINFLVRSESRENLAKNKVVQPHAFAVNVWIDPDQRLQVGVFDSQLPDELFWLVLPGYKSTIKAVLDAIVKPRVSMLSKNALQEIGQEPFVVKRTSDCLSVDSD